jgi:hypothetical protein
MLVLVNASTRRAPLHICTWTAASPRCMLLTTDHILTGRLPGDANFGVHSRYNAITMLFEGLVHSKRKCRSLGRCRIDIATRFGFA